MKIAIKYGLSITLVIVLWVLTTHFVFPLAPESKANLLAPVLFNLASIVFLYLGINAKDRQRELSFKEAIKTGVSISLVYGISSCLFFLIMLLIVGPRLMANEQMFRDQPLWQAALGAFAALLVGALVLGLIFSTVISFLLVSRRKDKARVGVSQRTS